MKKDGKSESLKIMYSVDKVISSFPLAEIAFGIVIMLAPLLYLLPEQGTWLLLCVISLLYIFTFHSLKGKTITVSRIDLYCIAYIAYGVFHFLIIRPSSADVSFFAQWILLTGIYSLVHHLSDRKTIVLHLIVLGGIFQACIVFLQLFGLLSSNHSEFSMTGSFSNPGACGGFLAIAASASLVLFKKAAQHQYKITITLALVILFTALIMIDSRASYLAFGISAVFYFYPHIPASKKQKYLFFIAVGIVVLSVLLYAYRPGSVHARLLIWRVCMDIFQEHWLLGHGVTSLPSLYMDYQATYFQTYPRSPFIDVANNHFQAFNEYIHLACEQGMVGLLLFLMIIFSCFKTEGNRKWKTLLCGLLVFSFFSYPADILSLKIFFPFLIGQMAQTDRVIARYKVMPLHIVLPALLLPLSLYMHSYCQKAFTTIRTSTVPVLAHNRQYMATYTKTVTLKRQDIQTYEQVTHHLFSTSEMLCDLGDLYKYREAVLQADSCYRKAYHMCPNRILPLYKLFLLYKDTNIPQALVYAEKIKEFTPKVVTSISLRAKYQSKEYLNQHSQTHE